MTNSLFSSPLNSPGMANTMMFGGTIAAYRTGKVTAMGHMQVHALQAGVHVPVMGTPNTAGPAPAVGRQVDRYS